MNVRIQFAILCASLAFSTNRACCDSVDPIAVLEAYVLWIPQDKNADSISDPASDKILTIKIEIELLRKSAKTKIPGFVEEVLNRVPEGTRVRMDDAPRVEFKWQNGESVVVEQ